MCTKRAPLSEQIDPQINTQDNYQINISITRGPLDPVTLMKCGEVYIMKLHVS